MSRHRAGTRPSPARPKEAQRPGRSAASLSVLPARFVTLSPAEAERAIEALATLLVGVLTGEGRASEPDATMG
jgi:hypothetical protein